MKIETVTYYVCEVCGERFLTEENCLDHETIPVKGRLINEKLGTRYKDLIKESSPLILKRLGWKNSRDHILLYDFDVKDTPYTTSRYAHEVQEIKESL